MAGEIVPVNPATMAAPGGHYSHVVCANGFVFVSGQLPIAPDGSKLNEETFEQQARQVLDNVAHALTAAGSSIAALTQVRVYVTDINSWPAFNAIYAAWAGAAKKQSTHATTGKSRGGIWWSYTGGWLIESYVSGGCSPTVHQSRDGLPRTALATGSRGSACAHRSALR